MDVERKPGFRPTGRLLPIVLLCLLALPLPATAQGYSFNVSPLLIELEGLPGSTLPFDIVISNNTVDQVATFTVQVVPLVQDRGGNYVVADSPGEHSAVDFIQIGPEEFTLGPDEGRVLEGQLTFPRSFRGGAYAGILFRLKPEDGPREGPVQVIQNEVVVVLEAVAVTPSNRAELHVGQMMVYQASQPGLESIRRQFGPQALLFAAEVTNEGNVHGFASGQVSLWDGAGRKIRELPLGAGRAAILPGATVQMASILSSGLPPGAYTLQAVIYYGGHRPAITRQSFVVGEELLQEAQGGRVARIGVEPLAVTYDLIPGANRFAALRLQNLDRVPITITGQVIPLVYDEAGHPNVEAVASGSSAAEWALLRPESVTLAPGQSRNLQVGIRTPRDASPGARYAQVLLTAVPATEAESFLETQVTVPIYALLGEELAARGELAPISVDPSEDGRFLIVGTAFTNRGNLHTSPSALVQMHLKTMPEKIEGIEYVGDPIWVEVARVQLPAPDTPVLPGGVRSLGALLEWPEAPGEYRIRVTVRYPDGSPLVQEKVITLTDAPQP